MGFYYIVMYQYRMRENCGKEATGFVSGTRFVAPRRPSNKDSCVNFKDNARSADMAGPSQPRGEDWRGGGGDVESADGSVLGRVRGRQGPARGCVRGDVASKADAGPGRRGCCWRWRRVVEKSSRATLGASWTPVSSATRWVTHGLRVIGGLPVFAQQNKPHKHTHHDA